jgi:hypothetical protein
LLPEDRPQNIDAYLQLMRMTTPPEGLDHFDFRADLGDVWVEPADPGVAGAAAAPEVPMAPAGSAREPDSLRAADREAAIGTTYRSGAVAVEPSPTTQGPSTLSGDTVFIDAGDTVAFDDSRYEELALNRFSDGDAKQGSARGGHGRRGTRAVAGNAWSGRRNAVVWLSLAAVAVLASAAALRWTQGSSAPHDDIITELAERPVAQASAPADVLVEPPATPGSGADLAAEPMPAEVPPATAAPVGAAPPASAPALVNAASAPRSSSARTARRPAAVGPIVETVIVQEPPPAPAPPPPDPPKPRPAPAPRVPSPQEACADAGFLARPMCIHQECQKPSQANQSICVESRRRYEADEQRRRQMPN